MRVFDMLFDNPILVKHARARLRPGQMGAWVVMITVLSAFTTWAGHSIQWISTLSAVLILIGIQVVSLTLGGASQINGALGGARESGILDFHRVAPTPPAVVALGFFLGAPIREYLIAAIPLPFALFSAYQIDAFDPWKGVLWFLQLEVAVLVSTWVAHAITALGCLTRKKARGSLAGGFAMLFCMLVFGSYGTVGFYFGARWLLVEPRTVNFFGAMIPWLAWLLIYEIPALGFLGLAVARKTGAERTHAYTKPQAIACMATLCTLVLGGVWKVARLIPESGPFEPTPSDAIMIAVVYGLTLAAMVLTVTITPDASEYVKGLRRATREGRRRPSPWTDAGSNRIALFALCALVLIGASTVVNVVGKPSLQDFRLNFQATTLKAIDIEAMSDQDWVASRRAFLSRPIAIGVLTAAYTGLAFQFFSLRTRTSGMVLLSLLIFALWLLPIVTGAILGLGGRANEERALVVLALSPVTGIALSSGLGKLPSADAIQLAAIAPAVSLAFLFNYLLVITQRKIDRQLLAQEKMKGRPDPELAADRPAARPIPAGEPR